MDVLCLAWQSSPRGTLQSGGEAWTLEILASMLSGDTRLNLALLEEAMRVGCIVSVDGILQIPELVKQAETSAARAIAGQRGGAVKQNPSKPPSKSQANGQANPQANGWQNSSKHPSTSSRALARIQNPESRVQKSENQKQEKTAAAAILEPEPDSAEVRYEPEPEYQQEPQTAADAADEDSLSSENTEKVKRRYAAIRTRPDWLPPGKPWIDDVAAMKIARDFTVTKERVEAAIKATRESRNTLANPAGFFICRVLEGGP
jgi:hypothetical protein